MVPPMADEFYEKYKHLSHQELYRMVRAGVVRQVDGVGDTWASIASTLSGLADSLRQDISVLTAGWDGNASNEALEGINALARRAKTLADEATGVRTGLTAMAQALAAAQREAEAPQEIPPVATQAVGFVLGAEVGHVPTPEQLARARERMVWVVARLAAQYGLAAHANWPAVKALPTAIADSMRLVVQGHGHDHGHHRHGTRLQGTSDLVRHHNQPSHLSAPISGHGTVSPQGLTFTSAEAAGALRAAGSGSGSASRAPSVHVVGSAPAMPVALPDGPGTAAAAAPPPPMGLGGGAMGGSGPVIGGAGGPGVGAPGGGLVGGGLAQEVSWQAADNVEWIDPDDAAPSVIGG